MYTKSRPMNIKSEQNVITVMIKAEQYQVLDLICGYEYWWELHCCAKENNLWIGFNEYSECFIGIHFTTLQKK